MCVGKTANDKVPKNDEEPKNDEVPKNDEASCIMFMGCAHVSIVQLRFSLEGHHWKPLEAWLFHK